ncbi:MAG: hypothetical protein CL674_06595 [Bdellovibrionaceae bacterium]|nr:hypothetical protein [Pseudobdellovibrionaceae bacterium]|tara:strand:- start:10169 stop:11173 length:1005 start_codon:yes stop_codon:yes gene_type:complete
MKNAIKHILFFVVLAGVSISLSAKPVCERGEWITSYLEYHFNKSCENITAEDLNSIEDFDMDKIVRSHDFRKPILEKYDFVGFNNLKYLSLYEISPAELDEDTFDPLFNLVSLDMSFLDFEGVDFSKVRFFKKLNKLRWLGLSNVEIKKYYKGMFDGLDNLVRLNMQGGQDLEMEVGVFDNLKQLKVLNIFLNPFLYKTEHRHLFSKLESLERLQITMSNDAIYFPGNLFRDLSNLKVLYINGGENLRSYSRYMFAGLKNLRHIETVHSDFIMNLPTDIFDPIDDLGVHYSYVRDINSFHPKREIYAVEKRFPKVKVCKSFVFGGCFEGSPYHP